MGIFDSETTLKDEENGSSDITKHSCRGIEGDFGDGRVFFSWHGHSKKQCRRRGRLTARLGKDVLISRVKRFAQTREGWKQALALEVEDSESTSEDGLEESEEEDEEDDEADEGEEEELLDYEPEIHPDGHEQEWLDPTEASTLECVICFSVARDALAHDCGNLFCDL